MFHACIPYNGRSNVKREPVPGCLYCGKDIGTFRLLRDREFCSAEHRKNYGRRLGAALGRIGAPEAPPAGIAGFQVRMPLQQGSLQFSRSAERFGRRDAAVRIAAELPVALRPVLSANALAHTGWPTIASERGSQFPDVAWLRGGGSACAAILPVPEAILGPAVPRAGTLLQSVLNPAERPLRSGTIRLEFGWPAARTTRKMPEIAWPQLGEEAALAVEAESVDPIPNASERQFPAPPAEAAERELVAAVAAWQDFGIRATQLPELRLDDALLAAGAIRGMPEIFAECLPGTPPQEVEREVIPAMAARFVEFLAMLMPPMCLAVARTAIEPVAGFRAQGLTGAVGAPEMAAERVASPAVTRLPEMRLEAAIEKLEQIPELYERFLPVPEAQAAEREVTPRAAMQFTQCGLIRLPGIRIPIEPASAEPASEFWPNPLPEAPAAATSMAAEHAMQDGFSRLPGMSVEAALEPVEQIPEPCEQPIPAPAAEPAEREVIPAVAQDVTLAAV